jgi:hypothetical protein
MKKLHIPVSDKNLPIVSSLSEDSLLEQLATLTTYGAPQSQDN